ncbi:hypothetical protein KIN20_017888 [Parelaphostrongylus tenuis]|uniref:Uncharacterized protein n=1 Tax=Parelaphostrongylus tenuis TaxID=148309 RepID=A0AAD5QNZ9_PARTN|nr:hypothetical protein KIN20_017888 [Parelaphostrongylus tenuis]
MSNLKWKKCDPAWKAYSESGEEDLLEDSNNSGEEDLVFANITSEDRDSDGEEENTPSNARTATGWSWNIVSPTKEFLIGLMVIFRVWPLLVRETPVEFYELFMKDVWELIVEQTNIYGHQKRTDGKIQRLKK